jgi:hypothetical protein
MPISIYTHIYIILTFLRFQTWIYPCLHNYSPLFSWLLPNASGYSQCCWPRPLLRRLGCKICPRHLSSFFGLFVFLTIAYGKDFHVYAYLLTSLRFQTWILPLVVKIQYIPWFLCILLYIGNILHYTTHYTAHYTTHYTTLHCTTLYCTHTTLHYTQTTQYTTLYCLLFLYYTLQYDTEQHSTICTWVQYILGKYIHSTAQYNIYSTAQYTTVQHSTTLYSTGTWYSHGIFNIYIYIYIYIHYIACIWECRMPSWLKSHETRPSDPDVIGNA